jgi:hypothetical protein
VCFCKPILQLFYKNTNASIRKRATHRHVIACVCFCKPILQLFYKNTNASIRKRQRIGMSSCACVFVSPSCNRFTKIQTHQSEKGNASACHSRALNPRFYFVHAGTKPRFLTKMRHQKSGIPCSVSSCACVFVSPSCNCFTKIQTHQSEKRQRIGMSSCACVFVSPSCNCFTKYKRINPKKGNASACHRVRVFCGLACAAISSKQSLN